MFVMHLPPDTSLGPCFRSLKSMKALCTPTFCNDSCIYPWIFPSKKVSKVSVPPRFSMFVMHLPPGSSLGPGLRYLKSMKILCTPTFFYVFCAFTPETLPWSLPTGFGKFKKCSRVGANPTRRTTQVTSFLNVFQHSAEYACKFNIVLFLYFLPLISFMCAFCFLVYLPPNQFGMFDFHETTQTVLCPCAPCAPISTTGIFRPN